MHPPPVVPAGAWPSLSFRSVWCGHCLEGSEPGATFHMREPSIYSTGVVSWAVYSVTIYFLPLRCLLPHTSASNIWPPESWRAHTSPSPWALHSLRP
jgi:hypothetical protein